MQYNCRNYYKLCRESACFTQEHAAELLVISVRSLSDYENGKTIPDDEIVDKMVDIYNTKLLGWWHLRNTSKLARKCLPDIQPPQTNSDIFLQIAFSEDEFLKMKDLVKEILFNKEITDKELKSYEEVKKLAKDISGKLMSISAYELEIQLDKE